MDRQQEFVLRSIEERDIRFVRLWFTDVLGFLKSVAVAPAELEQAFDEGIGFDGSAIEGLARRSEADMLLKPDPATFQVLPWRSDPNGSNGTARMFADVLNPDGAPAAADPRHVLRRTLTKAADQGFTFYTHPEIEFYLLKPGWQPGQEPEPVDEGGYFDHVPRGTGHDFRRAAISLLENMGISVEFSHHEGGPGQNEIDLRYADALATADNIMTFRTVIKEVALEQGIYASFMPKPMAPHPGSGMHTHMSLFEGDRNAFHEAGAQYQLSKTARQFIAGLLRHAGEIAAVTNQFVNSYKRLWSGGEAPSYVCWGHNNRSALVRVPMYKPGKGQSVRIEHRGARQRLQPLPRLRRAARRRAEGHRGGVRAAGGRRGRRLVAHRRRAACAGHRPAAQQPRGRDPHDGGLGAGRRDPGRAGLRLRAAQQAAGVAGLPAPGHALRAAPVPAHPVSRTPGPDTRVARRRARGRVRPRAARAPARVRGGHGAPLPG